MRVGIFHTAFIGDLANCGSLIESLYLSKHEVILITNGAGAQLFLYDERLAKRVVVKKLRGIKKLLSIYKIAQIIKSNRVDILLVPHRSFTSALVAKFSQVPVRVGFEGFFRKLFFTELLPFEINKHESQRLLSLGKSTCFGESDGTGQACQTNSLSATRKPLKFFEIFPELDPDQRSEFNSAEYFVISPGSVWATKRYPLGHWREVIEKLLLQNPRFVCVLCGGPDERNLVHQLKGFFDKSLLANRVYDGVDAVPLCDLPSVIGRAKFSISNDSAPLHIGCAVGCPTVGVYGPTSELTGFGPVGMRSAAVSYNLVNENKLSCQPCSSHGHDVCPKRHFRCMNDLKPDDVVQAVFNILR